MKGDEGKVCLCEVKDCKCDSSRRIPNDVEVESAAPILGEIGRGARICNAHYQALYKYLHSPKPCAGCGELPHARESNYRRHCPNHSYITKYLKHTLKIDMSLSKDDVICDPCYHMYNRIIQNGNDGEASLYAKVSEVESLATNFKLATSLDESDFIDGIANLTALKLSHILLSDEAILLSCLYESFLLSAQKYASKLSNCTPKLPGMRWLQVYLSNTFSYNLEIIVKHKCYGAILYRKGGDILHALSKALGELKGASKREVDVRKEIHQSLHLSQSSNEDISDDQIIKVCMHVNKLINENIRKVVGMYQNDTNLYSSFTFRGFTESVDDILPKIITALTQPVKSKRKLLYNTQNEELRLAKKAYCLLVLMYCTNNQCNPLHFILTDSVLSNHGSTSLVKIFNKLGACVSLDTHNRIVNSIATERMTKGIIPQLTPNTLSIISIDNVDILQPHSMVSTLGSHTWHGTSVQCTQPRPVTIKLENDEPTIEPMCTGISYAESAPSKRGYSSPIESPIPKQHSKRLRTFTECSTFSSTVSVDMTQIHLHHNVEYCPSPLSYFTIADFKLISMESQRLEKIKNTVFKYIITKRFSDDKNNYPSMYYFVSESNYGRLNTEKSQIHFMNVFSLKADCQDTVIFILHQIYNKFICSQSLKWVVVVGDAKTYDILQKVKREQCLSWLIVFPGDWHILYNYQKVLMKVYWDAGLMQLAQAAGYKGEALTSLSKASNFRRTHDFLLQVYEAFVSTFAENFLSQHSEIETSEIQLLATALTKAGTSDDLSHAIKNVLDYHSKQANVHEQFSSYIRDTVQSSKTQVFWKNFVEFDVFAYVSLFIAIRNSDWQLRLASLKTMAAIFFAFDRPIYQRLVSTHLTDILQMPNELKKYFDDNGAFSVHITSRANHATALDETHEMCINRIIKNIVKRPNPELIEHASYAYPFRNACQSQLKQELGMDVQNTNEHKGLKITNVNIRRMIDLIETKKVLSSDDTGRLANMFSATMATADQEHDLLSFRQVGQAEFENHIEFKILHKPSAKTPSRLKRLKTFSVSKQTKQKASQINKENKIIQSCIQKQLALCRSGQFNSSINPPYIPLPRALVTADGFPHKGNKSNITNFFKSRYKDLNVVSSYFPSNWIPDSVLLEGMFLIQTVPSLGVDSYSNYCQMVASRFILPHFKNGVKEVHVIFDSENNETESHHEHQDITENGTIPSNWRVDVIHCRIDIRETVWKRIANEEYALPSWEALFVWV
jgi:hypothetical protein